MKNLVRLALSAGLLTASLNCFAANAEFPSGEYKFAPSKQVDNSLLISASSTADQVVFDLYASFNSHDGVISGVATPIGEGDVAVFQDGDCTVVIDKISTNPTKVKVAVAKDCTGFGVGVNANGTYAKAESSETKKK